MPAGYAPGLSVPARYPQRYRDILNAAAARYRVPARVLAAQEFVESGYNRDVIAGRRKSSAGAGGISQFIESTGRAHGVILGTSRRAVRSQVFAHGAYLDELGYQKDPRLAIASYAGGPGNPQFGYAAKVLGLSRSYRGIGRGGARSAGGGTPGIPGTPAMSTRSEQGTGGTALAELTAKALQRQQGPPSFSLPAPPVHTAHVVLPEGQAANPPQSGLVVPQTAGPSVTDLLAAARQDASVQDARSTVTPGTPGTPAAVTPDRRGAPHGTQHVKGVARFDGKPVAAWIKPWLVYARKHGWKGTVSSGYRSYADQVRIYNSGVRPAARPGTSNHEGSTFPRGAVDVGDGTAGQLAAILRRAHSPLVYAGAKDRVHFSHPHNGGY